MSCDRQDDHLQSRAKQTWREEHLFHFLPIQVDLESKRQKLKQLTTHIPILPRPSFTLTFLSAAEGGPAPERPSLPPSPMG